MFKVYTLMTWRLLIGSLVTDIWTVNVTLQTPPPHKKKKIPYLQQYNSIYLRPF